MVSNRISALGFLFLAYITSNNNFTCALEIDQVNIIVTRLSNKTENIRYYPIRWNNTEIINIEVTANASFFVVQVHSFSSPVILSNDKLLQRQYSVRGNSVGLVQRNIHSESRYRFYVQNNITDGLMIIAVTTYGKNDPIPGGCNLTFDVEDAPYQVLNYTDDLITIDAQAASEIARFCENTRVSLEMYHMRLTRWDFTADSFYRSIEKMITVEGIRKNGVKEWASPYKNKLRRFFVNYAGTGTVYAIIATYDGHSSAYVPILSYGCDISNGNCSPVTDHGDKYALAFLFTLFGIQMILFGRKLTIPQCNRHGILKWICLAFIVIPLFLLEISIYYLLGASFLILALFTVSNVLIVTSQIISSIYIAYIATCAIFFFTPWLGDMVVFQEDWCYWLVFVTTVFAMYTFSRQFNWNVLLDMQLSIGISYFVGGILLYMFLYNYKRLTVTNFNYAISDPPITYFEYINLLVVLVISRLVLFLVKFANKISSAFVRRFSSSTVIQSSVTPSVPDEATPLLL
ncbi:PREDICTED: transmembrane 7 superfamily member 3-like [Nicrophorus vespilloides]|uniref:Transmembrane 7 superfamily member 3-like n=1 Tax=Nicrophorus vespilloides TaxID=110193 RepID=A0ABM1MXE7_NICVS|nr:PREDICTED: transmembrane 7 superfamily member 3-like [Nicrophorus vespilloides]